MDRLLLEDYKDMAVTDETDPSFQNLNQKKKLKAKKYCQMKVRVRRYQERIAAFTLLSVNKDHLTFLSQTVKRLECQKKMNLFSV